MSSPHISFVIPVYNEESILHAAIVDLRERLKPHRWNYEIILAENGSKDATIHIAKELAERYPEVRFISVSDPNYGRALREGVLTARGDLVLCEEIDLCDVSFHERAVALLDQGAAQMVIGSKLIGGARDERPWLRHAASVVYTGLLRGMLGLRGTDTHGLKAFKRKALVPIVHACLVDKDVFASELVIRAYREGIAIREIPVRVKEMRPPSINLFKRVPNVLSSVARLTWAIRFKG